MAKRKSDQPAPADAQYQQVALWRAVLPANPKEYVRGQYDGYASIDGVAQGSTTEFAEQGGEAPTPYEVLIHAALVGDAMRFTRQDGVAEQWRIMQPLLDKPSPIHPYPPGTWGPEAADKLTASFGGWRDLWVVQS